MWVPWLRIIFKDSIFKANNTHKSVVFLKTKVITFFRGGYTRAGRMLRRGCEFISHGRAHKDCIHKRTAKLNSRGEDTEGRVWGGRTQMRESYKNSFSWAWSVRKHACRVSFLSKSHFNSWPEIHRRRHTPPSSREKIFISSGLLRNVAADKATENISGSAFSKLGSRDSLSEPSSTFLSYHFLKACYL